MGHLLAECCCPGGGGGTVPPAKGRQSGWSQGVPQGRHPCPLQSSGVSRPPEVPQEHPSVSLTLHLQSPLAQAERDRTAADKQKSQR